MEIVISVVIAIVAVFALSFFLKKPIFNAIKNLFKEIGEENKEIIKQEIRDERERLIQQYKSEKEILDERMKNAGQFIESKKDTIKELVERINRELEESKQKIENTEKERIGEFKTLKAVLDEYKIITGGLKESTDHLKSILSNNQLRGHYGEEVAENLLKSVGFVKGQNYTVNKSQDSTQTRPDFTIFLPDKTKINVDSKFPLQSLIKYQDTDEKLGKERYLREFSTDVKEKIKQVSTRDYINPEEKTVDFVILFVPNEMIFSFIYDRLNDVWKDAMDKKVILAGPFSFTAIIRMIFQSYKNFKYQENLYEIIKLIKTFEKEYSEFNTSLDKLGTRIKSVSEQYETVSTTRTRKLTRVIDKIKGEDLLPEPKEIEIIKNED